jgi:hypothetical protein
LRNGDEAGTVDRGPGEARTQMPAATTLLLSPQGNGSINLAESLAIRMN